MVSNENVCCFGDLSAKDEDIEILDYCFSESSNLSESERWSLHFICGYVTFKENLVSRSHIAFWKRVYGIGITRKIETPSDRFVWLVDLPKILHPQCQTNKFSFTKVLFYDNTNHISMIILYFMYYWSAFHCFLLNKYYSVTLGNFRPRLGDCPIWTPATISANNNSTQ